MVRQRKAQSGKENVANARNVQSGSTSSNKPFKKEFKFFGHDSGRKNGYTYEKIEEAIITKIQATFEGNTVPFIVRSLRDRTKHLFAEPQLVVSEATDVGGVREREQRKNDKKYDKQYDTWIENNAEFDSLWQKAYALIWESYCSTELKITAKEMSMFNSHIRDDPLILLQTVEHLMHVPMKAVYPTLTLIESMSRMLSIKQGEREGLSTYLERFKSEKM